MADSDNDKEEIHAEFGDEPSVDEELLTLSGPPPSLRYGLITLGVIVLSVVMLVWFYPELEYLLQAFKEPQNLGDAASIDVSTLKSNSYASVDGIPWVTRTIDYNEGIKWFPNVDNSRMLFPLTGQNKLFVQCADELTIGLASEITAPPSRCMAVSKLIRVLVLGWKKSVAITLPWARLMADRFQGSSARASSNRP